jgi:hypothetical protein
MCKLPWKYETKECLSNGNILHKDEIDSRYWTWHPNFLLHFPCVKVLQYQLIYFSWPWWMWQVALPHTPTHCVTSPCQFIWVCQSQGALPNSVYCLPWPLPVKDMQPSKWNWQYINPLKLAHVSHLWSSNYQQFGPLVVPFWSPLCNSRISRHPPVFVPVRLYFVIFCGVSLHIPVLNKLLKRIFGPKRERKLQEDGKT